MASGIIIIDKPQDWTSQDVAARLRRVFATRRIGHGGTLDPMATGVLPVFVGRATRAVEFFDQAEKTYVATLRLGQTTDTEDIWGRTLSESLVDVGPAEVEAVLRTFLGRQQQTPPMYSAVKIGGKKLYELARQGKEIQRPSREIEIRQIELLSHGDQDYVFRVTCSKGTYIRTLCKDIGQALGCGGTMAALRRTRAGAYGIEDAIPLGELLERSESGENVEHLLLPVDSMFRSDPAARLNARQERLCRNGGSFPWTGESGRYRLYAPGGEFLALGSCENGVMKTVKSFFALPEET